MSFGGGVVEAYLEAHPAEAASVLEGQTPEATAAFLDGCSPAAVGAVLAQAGRGHAASCLRLMDPDHVRRVLEDLGAAQAAPLLRPLPAAERERIIQGLAPEVAAAITRAVGAPPGSVGELMDPHPFSIPDELTIRAARKRVRKAGDAARTGIFLVSREGGLHGVVPFRDLILAEGNAPIISIVDASIGSVPIGAPAAAIVAHPSWAMTNVLPVVDDRGRLAGTVSRDAVAGTGVAPGSAELAGPLGTTLTLGELYFVSAARLMGMLMTPRQDIAEEEP